eukprot:4185583-Heterocapsa_arctica.AAC.1
MEVNTGHFPQRPNQVFTVPIIPGLHSVAGENTSNPRTLRLSGSIGNLSAGRDEDHRASERKPQRFRFGALSTEPGAALFKGRIIVILVIRVITETIVRGSEGPETLRETGVNHASASSLKDVK